MPTDEPPRTSDEQRSEQERKRKDEEWSHEAYQQALADLLHRKAEH